MALSEFEVAKINKVVGGFIEARRPPEHLRDQLDISFKLDKQSVLLFDIRPDWKKPEQKNEYPFAKITYIKTIGQWKLFWQRADLKWHKYPLVPFHNSIEDALATIQEDKHGCFFG